MIGVIFVIVLLFLLVACPAVAIGIMILFAVVSMVILIMKIGHSGNHVDAPPPKPKEKTQHYMTEEDFMASVDMYANWDYGDD